MPPTLVKMVTRSRSRSISSEKKKIILFWLKPLKVTTLGFRSIVYLE